MIYSNLGRNNIDKMQKRKNMKSQSQERIDYSKKKKNKNRWKSAIFSNKQKFYKIRPKTFYYKQMISGEEERKELAVSPTIKIDSNKRFLRVDNTKVTLIGFYILI